MTARLESLECEQILLGGIVSHPELLDELSPSFSPKVFSSDFNRRVFEIISGSPLEQGKLSVAAISPQLASLPEIGEMSPKDFVSILAQDYEVAADSGFVNGKGGIPGIADTLVDLARRRFVADRATRLASDAIDPLKPIAESSAAFEADLAGGDFCGAQAEHMIEAAAESVAMAIKIAAGEGPQGLQATLKAWNEIVGPMMAGDLVVVGGATSMGKTALVQQVAYQIASDKNVLVFSMEMTRRQWTDRYLSAITKIPTERIEVGPIHPLEVDALKRAAEEHIKPKKLFLCDNNLLTPRQMRSIARRVQRRVGLDMIVVDHLQFIEHHDPKRDGPSKISDITRALKALAKELRVPIVLVSHLNRDISHRENKRPQLADLFGSSAIEKDADAVLFVHREHYWISRQGPKASQWDDPEEDEANRMKWEAALERTRNQAELILAKRRRGRGSGSKMVKFLPETTTFEDLDR